MYVIKCEIKVKNLPNDIPFDDDADATTDVEEADVEDADAVVPPMTWSNAWKKVDIILKIIISN